MMMMMMMRVVIGEAFAYQFFCLKNSLVGRFNQSFQPNIFHKKCSMSYFAVFCTVQNKLCLSTCVGHLQLVSKWFLTRPKLTFRSFVFTSVNYSCFNGLPPDPDVITTATDGSIDYFSTTED